MKKAIIILFSLNILLVHIIASGLGGDDKNFKITKLTENAYLIQSSYSCNGHLDCNHLLVVDSKDIVLVNTHAKDSLTTIMLNHIHAKFNRPVTKVIASHFHDDSSGGLTATANQGIISYSTAKTRDLVKTFGKRVDITFTDSMTIELQSFPLQLFYFGPGHTVDNMVIWFPKDKILFGGCLLKSIETKNQGNIADADLLNWAGTVKKVKNRFPDAQVVIPGHMAIGNVAIFDHTIDIAEMK